MRDEGAAALNARVADVADLLAVEAVPLAVVEALDEGDDGGGGDHVDEGVADVALVLQGVDGVELTICELRKGNCESGESVWLCRGGLSIDSTAPVTKTCTFNEIGMHRHLTQASEFLFAKQAERSPTAFGDSRQGAQLG